MKISFSNIRNKDQRLYIRKLVDYSIRFLFLEDMDDRYKLIFREDPLMTRNNYAKFYPNKLLEKSTVYKIDIRIMNNIELITKTIFHEMAHVKQYHREELIETPDETTHIWHGEFYPIKEGEYWSLPWEIEAYGYEYCMFNDFAEKYNLTKKIFNLDYAAIMSKMGEVK